jgi:NAD(P)-dependent dehydrogenase (short-subunit alcohol dehydrogenase family)
MMALSDHVAIVTGGARGIGKGIAMALGDAGARVIIADVDALAAKATAAELETQGHEALGLAVDVSQRHLVERMTETAINRWGQIDILVANAGINDNTPVLELTDEVWHKVLSVNLTGVLLCGQIVGRHMFERGYGRIINISSAAAQFGAPNLAAYAASKAGIVGLTRVMAVEWGPHGVTVNAVCPGNIDTEMLQTVFERRAPLEGLAADDIAARITAKTPAGRLGTPADVAVMVVFLASPSAAYVTGQAINVCGGRTTSLS